MDGTVDVVLPCLDEAAVIAWVLARMPAWARPILVDNGSTDGSPELAASLGATVVREAQRGYDAAATRASRRRPPRSWPSWTATGAWTRQTWRRWRSTS